MGTDPIQKAKAKRRVGGIKNLGFTLKSPLGYNKQIKTAKALIIQQYTQQKALRRAQRWSGRKFEAFYFFGRA